MDRLDFHIEKMTAGDLKSVMEIECASFPTAWSERMFRSELKSPLSWSLVAKRDSDSRLTGYINFWIFAGEVHLNNIAVHPEFRMNGIGSLLMKGLISTARQEGALWLTLEVRPSNHAAIALYEKFGFKVRGVRPRYYTDTQEDAYIMWSDVESENGSKER